MHYHGSVGNKNNTFFTHQKHRLGKRTMTTSSNNNINNKQHGATKTMQSFSATAKSRRASRRGRRGWDAEVSIQYLGDVARGSDYVGTAVRIDGNAVSRFGAGWIMPGAPVIGLITAVGGGTIRDFVLGAGRRVLDGRARARGT